MLYELTFLLVRSPQRETEIITAIQTFLVFISSEGSKMLKSEKQAGAELGQAQFQLS